MSSMLEQAIIDANALRESAIKNAEAMIVEKYSDQIKEAVSSILEEDGLEDEGDQEFDPSLDEIPLATAEDLPDNLESDVADEDTPIVIDLPQLKQRIRDYEEEMGELPEPDMTSDELATNLEPAIDAAPEMSQATPDVDLTATASPMLEGNVENNEANRMKLVRAIGEGLPDDQKPGFFKSENKRMKFDDAYFQKQYAAYKEDFEHLDEEIDLEQSIVDQIMEKLSVDIEPQMSGHMNRPESEMKEMEAMELAKRQDEEVAEEMDALKSTIEELQESIKLHKSKQIKLAKENKKYVDAVLLLKEKVEIVNVSNAKLLYINKTLESDSLNERQRRKLVEAISKAETPKEAKVIYETLQSTVGSTEVPSVPKSLSEAVNRNSSLILNSQRKENKKDDDIFSERMQRLAGINNKKNN